MLGAPGNIRWVNVCDISQSATARQPRFHDASLSESCISILCHYRCTLQSTASRGSKFFGLRPDRPLAENGILRILSPSGGFCDPRERSSGSVLRDIADLMISPEAASND